MIWGPIAGFYAKHITDHELKVIPMRNELRVKFDFQISMAVRFRETQWQAKINHLITDNQQKINYILDEYGVPRLEMIAPAKNDKR